MGVVAALAVRITANTADFDKALGGLEKQFSSLGGKMQGIGSKMTAGITLPLVAVGGAAVKAAADFEDAFSGVAKTVDGVADKKGALTDFGKELQKGFRELAKTIPVTVNELAKIGETAGAMGIPKEKILDFTSVMAKLGATTDLTSDQAASSIGKIQNVYKAAGVETDRFASTLVALGNAGASTESQILNFAERMGGAAVQANISQAEVLGWANAMASVGLNAELGSTAWNKVSSNIGVAVDLGNEKLMLFAKVAGMTAQSFSTLFKADASEAMLRVVEGFGKIKESGGNVTKVMQDLGMKTSGIQMTFKNLASSGDLVRQSLELGKKAWQDNVAMEEEFTKKSVTTISQLKILYNRLYDVGISLGEQLIPAFMKLMPVANSFLNMLVRLVQGFANLPEWVQTAVIGLVAFVAAMGPVIFGVGTLVRAISGIAGAARLVGPGFTAIGNAAAAAGLTVGGGTIVGIIALGAAFAVLAIKIHESIQEFGLWNTARAGFLQAAAGGAFGPVVKAAFTGGGGNGSNRSPRVFTGPGKSKDTHLPFEPPKSGATDPLKGLFSPEELAAMTGGEGGGKTGKKARVNPFSGAALIEDAEQAMKDIAQIGGVTKLTTEETKKLHETLDKAIEKYHAMGQQVPLDMARVWGSTMQATTAVTGISKSLLATIGTKVNPTPFLDMGPGVISGMGGLPLPGATGVVPGAGVTLPGILEQMFGQGPHKSSATNFGANMSGTIMSALTGGGDVGKSLGGLLGGEAMKGLAGKAMEKLGEKGLGGVLGGVLGSVLPGIGNILGALGGSAISGLFGKLFGGEKKKTNKARDAFIEQAGGIDALKKAAEEANFSLDKLLSTKKVKDFEGEVGKLTQAMEAQKATMKAISDITAGVNARAGNVTGQGDLDVVGAGAVASFALMMQNGSSAIEAFQALTPAITAMNTAMASGNFTLSESAMRLTELGAILNANNVEFTNLGASGQILQAMLQGNIRDGALFAAVATDIGTQIQTVIDRGVPMGQVFALAQPQLQALWEAQQKWGFAVDATTQGLLTEAAAQGFVGQQMKGINQQILDVLLAIGKVLGADIPAAFAGLPAAAQSAANGINAAFAGVGGIQEMGAGTVDQLVPMASGGIVRRPTAALIGEAGPEAVMPLNGAFSTGGGTAIIQIDGRTVAEAIVPAIPGVVQRYGLS